MNIKILGNDTEINYAKQNSLEDSLNLSLIPLIKRIMSKNRMKIMNNSSKLINEINGFVDKYPNSKIIFFPQFNKGDTKSREELEIIGSVQQESNLDTFVFQESDKNNNLEEFNRDFERARKFFIGKEIFAVLDIKSKYVEDKIDFLLINGVRNFILRGGEYNNIRKWIEIRESINRLKGNFIISVYGRWDKNMVSYFKYALELGCNHTFHEKIAPFKIDVRNILNLNNDFTYGLIPVNGDYGVNITERNDYSFSRVRTLLKAQELSANVQILQRSET